MIASLYEPYKKWSEGGSIYIISDLHFDDEDCLLMASDWIKPEKQIEIINSLVMKSDTFVCLGDVGKADYIKQIKAKRKILLLGNHDRRADYVACFDEIYTGPLFISEKILLSHEPVYGLPWCLNIHGHDHNNVESYREDCKHLNLAANVCNYTPINLGKMIKDGLLSDVSSIHRVTIDKAVRKKQERKAQPVVMSSHDFGNSYWIRPVKISNAEQIYFNEVEELNPEISVPAEHVDGIVFEIFKRYLEMDLEYNKRRIRFDYDPNGKSVIGFGIDMIHNFYDAEHVEKLAYNLIAVSLYLCDRHYAPEELDISKEVVKEIDKYDAKLSEMYEADQFEKKWEYAGFLRDLADHLMGLIDYGKDKDAIISIMAP